MPFRTPLTAEQLAEIRARYEISARRAPCSYQDTVVWKDILTLMFEIKRLRCLALTAHQLRESFKMPNSCLDTVWQEFMDTLAIEPCVTELGELKDEMLMKPKRRAKPNAE